MLKRQNDQNRLALLAGSSNSESEDSSSSELSNYGSSSDEKESKPKKVSKEKPKQENANSKDSIKTLLNSEDELQFVPVTPEGEKKPGEDDEKSDVGSDDEIPKKKKIKFDDPYEREIFGKDFLKMNGASPTASPSSSTTSKPVKKEVKAEQVSSQEKSPSKDGSIDLTMFESRRVTKEIDLEKIFEKRANNDTTGPSSVLHQAKPQPPPVINEDEWISLSSDSDSEVSAPTPGSSARIPKRKKMLTEEELQEETKKAQKEENDRVSRLQRKTEALTQLLEERQNNSLALDLDSTIEELILDYDEKKKVVISVDSMLVKHLKPHQKDGIKFMYDTCYGSINDEKKTESGCILAHCMGLGKTLQLITLLHTLIMHPELKTKKVLVICPKSTIMNWSEEFKNWLKGIDSKGLKVFYLEEPRKFSDRVKVIEGWYNLQRPGVFLINYEAFRYMANYSGSKRAAVISDKEFQRKETERLQGIINKCLLKPGPDLVVCDEGHLIKNQLGATNRAITKISTRRRIILTGTPVQNNLNEYFAMVDWIKPNLLGTVKEFNNLYANPIKDGQHQDSTNQMIRKMKQRSFILYKKLSKFVQRKEAMVLREFLPEKYEYCIFVPLTPVQEELYEKFLSKSNFNFH